MGKEGTADSSGQARAAAEDAVRRGDDVSEEVRRITVDALSRGRLDYENIKSVVKAVLEGAQDALRGRPGNEREALGEVLQGLDEALEKSAQASRLAIEEAAGNVKDFTRGDLKRAMDDLAGLEDIFLESLSEVAKSGRTAAADAFEELLGHLRNSGTAAGRRAGEEAARLSDVLGRAANENVESMTGAARSISRDVARIASGFLAGLSDSLKEPRGDKTPGKKPE